MCIIPLSGQKKPMLPQTCDASGNVSERFAPEVWVVLMWVLPNERCSLIENR
jgi:hypothetical protein